MAAPIYRRPGRGLLALGKPRGDGSLVAAWELRFSKRAQKDKGKLEEAGLWPEALDMLKAIQRDPWRTPPPYEKLKGDLAGLLSRRITYTHRLVYEVDEGLRVVKVLAMWSHYE